MLACHAGDPSSSLGQCKTFFIFIQLEFFLQLKKLKEGGKKQSNQKKKRIFPPPFFYLKNFTTQHTLIKKRKVDTDRDQ